MKVLGIAGTVISILFLGALLIAMSNRIDMDEFDLVAYGYTVFAVAMCIAGMATRTSPKKLGIPVVCLGALYVIVYILEMITDGHPIQVGQPSLFLGFLLSVGTQCVGNSMARKRGLQSPRNATTAGAR